MAQKTLEISINDMHEWHGEGASYKKTVMGTEPPWPGLREEAIALYDEDMAGALLLDYSRYVTPTPVELYTRTFIYYWFEAWPGYWAEYDMVVLTYGGYFDFNVPEEPADFLDFIKCYYVLTYAGADHEKSASVTWDSLFDTEVSYPQSVAFDPDIPVAGEFPRGNFGEVWNYPDGVVTCSKLYIIYQYDTTLAVETLDPTEILDTTVTLNGNLTDDAGAARNCWFEYGETTDYGETTAIQSKTTGQDFSQALTGLSRATTYHYRAATTDGEGYAYGEDKTFGTVAIDTLDAANITYQAAELWGQLTWLEGTWVCGFEYGKVITFGSESGTGVYAKTTEYHSPITSLEKNILYYFRAYGFREGHGTAYGEMKYFITNWTNPENQSGFVWIEGTKFHYLDAAGVEHAVEGV